MAPRVGKSKVGKYTKLFTLGMVLPDSSFTQACQTVRAFNLRVLEGAFLKIQIATRAPFKSGDTVM